MGTITVDDHLLRALGLQESATLPELISQLRQKRVPLGLLELGEEVVLSEMRVLAEGERLVKREEMLALLERLAGELPNDQEVLYALALCAEDVRIERGFARRWR